MKQRLLDKIRKRVAGGERLYWILFDPDDFSLKDAAEVAGESQTCGVDALLVGGSLLHTNHFNSFVENLKRKVKIPVIIFPGDSTQLSRNADALLYLSLISGRNPVNLIGEHVKAAPIIREIGIEPISTAYLLVESGNVSSVEFMSNTRPLPRNKPAIAAAHALAAQYMGMSMVYLEAGSGARMTVPEHMISMVRSYIDIPIIVRGGIRDTATAIEKVRAGADIIVTGNMLQKTGGLKTMNEIAREIRKIAKKKASLTR